MKESSPCSRGFIIPVIVFAGVLVGMETSPSLVAELSDELEKLA